MERIAFKADYGVGQITSNDMKIKINREFVNNKNIEGYKGSNIFMTSNNQLKIQIAFHPNNNVVKSTSKLLKGLSGFDLEQNLRSILDGNFIPKGSTPYVEQRDHGNFVITLDTVTTFNNIFVNPDNKYVYKILNFLNSGNMVIFQIAQYDRTYFNNNMGNFNRNMSNDNRDDITPKTAAAALLPGYDNDNNKRKKKKYRY